MIKEAILDYHRLLEEDDTPHLPEADEHEKMVDFYKRQKDFIGYAAYECAVMCQSADKRQTTATLQTNKRKPCPARVA